MQVNSFNLCANVDALLFVTHTQARAKHGSGDCLDASGVCSDVREQRGRVCPNHEPVIRSAIAASLGFDLANDLVRRTILTGVAAVLRRALTLYPPAGERRDPALVTALLMLLRGPTDVGGGEDEAALLEALFKESAGAGTPTSRLLLPAAAEDRCVPIAAIEARMPASSPASYPRLDEPSAPVLGGRGQKAVSAADFMLNCLTGAEWCVLREKRAVARDGSVLRPVQLTTAEEAAFDRHRLALCVALGAVLPGSD